jgi:hypothetical protein
LSKEPGKRQHSVHEFFEELSNALYGQPARVHEKKQTPEQAAGWIPFDATTSGGGLAIRAKEESPISLDWDALLQAEQKQKQGIYLHEFRRKRRQFWFRVGLVLAILIGACFGLSNNRDKISVETADVLASHGRPEDAVRVFEKLKENHTLSVEDSEKLNNAYVQSAMKYAKKRQYQDALDMLQHVSQRSRYNDQAELLMRKYKRHIPSS